MEQQHQNSIIIVVKTDVEEKLGTCCRVDPSLSFREILDQIGKETNRITDDSSLIRLKEDNKTLHGYIVSGNTLNEDHVYLLVDEATDDEDDDDEEEEEDVKPSAVAAGSPPKERTKTNAAAAVVTPVRPRTLPFARAPAPAATAVAVATAAVEPAKKKAKLFIPKKGNVPALTEEEREQLSGTTVDLEQLEEYLTDMEEMGRRNVGSVLRQVKKLMSGDGIDYKPWGLGVAFCKGRVVEDLGEDFFKLRQEAIAFEAQHGEDKGHGWLLKHPIKKLENYQEYYFRKWVD